MKDSEMSGTCSMYGGREKCIRDLGGKPVEKSLLCRCGWGGDIKIVLKEIGGEDMAWVDLVKDRQK